MDVSNLPDKKRCWICFDTEDDVESSRNWVAPCKCHGSTQWVHQSCIQHWIDEKSIENDHVEAHCPLCLSKYKISYDELNLFVLILNKLDDQAGLMCPYLSAGIVIATAYWGAASYGAITVMQVMGEEEALEVMEGSNPYLLLLLLPSIPLGLITSKMIDWEKPFLSLMHRLTSRLPLLKTIMPSFLYEPISRPPPNNVQIYPVNSPTITFSSALLFPSVATIIGKLLFRNRSYSNIHKTLLGGVLYITIRSAMRIYQRQHNALQWKTRRVCNLSEDKQ